MAINAEEARRALKVVHEFLSQQKYSAALSLCRKVLRMDPTLESEVSLVSSVAKILQLSRELSPPNYYEMLDLAMEATSRDVKAAFRKKALELHPDKNPTQGANEAFAILKQAQTILSDTQERYIYDNNLRRAIALKNSQPHAWFDYSNVMHAQPYSAPTSTASSHHHYPNTDPRSSWHNQSQAQSNSSTANPHHTGHTFEGYSFYTSHYHHTARPHPYQYPQQPQQPQQHQQAPQHTPQQQHHQQPQHTTSCDRKKWAPFNDPTKNEHQAKAAQFHQYQYTEKASKQPPAKKQSRQNMPRQKPRRGQNLVVDLSDEEEPVAEEIFESDCVSNPASVDITEDGSDVTSVERKRFPSRSNSSQKQSPAKKARQKVEYDISSGSSVEAEQSKWDRSNDSQSDSDHSDDDALQNSDLKRKNPPRSARPSQFKDVERVDSTLARASKQNLDVRPEQLQSETEQDQQGTSTSASNLEALSEPAKEKHITVNEQAEDAENDDTKRYDVNGKEHTRASRSRQGNHFSGKSSPNIAHDSSKTNSKRDVSSASKRGFFNGFDETKWANAIVIDIDDDVEEVVYVDLTDSIHDGDDEDIEEY
eukprot:TRINITY_DN2264_c0_g2_i6.p1 TRINITY_DN2264_c0_g2~~TRINITY_DN2264_c0_g2_i6.p1  ORF type:complete len:604 (-),score=157.16 TRINITY_DN2264_c0_g2_i6:1616-3391(-)